MDDHNGRGRPHHTLSPVHSAPVDHFPRTSYPNLARAHNRLILSSQNTKPRANGTPRGPCIRVPRRRSNISSTEPTYTNGGVNHVFIFTINHPHHVEDTWWQAGYCLYGLCACVSSRRSASVSTWTACWPEARSPSRRRCPASGCSRTRMASSECPSRSSRTPSTATRTSQRRSATGSASRWVCERQC